MRAGLSISTLRTGRQHAGRSTPRLSPPILLDQDTAVRRCRRPLLDAIDRQLAEQESGCSDPAHCVENAYSARRDRDACPLIQKRLVTVACILLGSVRQEEGLP
jgi:hypothetical protein